MKRMKFTRAIATLLMLPVLSGCFKEDYSMCPAESNVTLEFTLPDRDGNETLPENISSVDVMVYDHTGRYVLAKRVEQNELMDFQGTILSLEPGDYYFACWGNVEDKTCYSGLETDDEPSVTYRQINAGKVGQADRLYSAGSLVTRAAGLPANYAVTVPKNGGYHGTAVFSASHRQLEVYVRGYSDGGNTLPDIELCGLPAGLCLGGTPLTGRPVVDSRSATQAVTVQAKTYAAAMFRTFWFDAADNDIIIYVKSPSTGQTAYAVPLSEAMEQNADPDMIVIRIVLEFANGDVTVHVPDWNPGDIGFGFDHGY